MYYTYVIKSLKNERFYVGSANDLERRITEHNDGKSKYTRLTRPFKSVYFENIIQKKKPQKENVF